MYPLLAAETRSILQFLAFAEQLKSVMRHSYTSGGRLESVAEHSWMLCLLAMTVFDHLAVEVDQLKVLKMLVLHDLPEAITGDIPTFDKLQNAEQIHAQELEAMQQMLSVLPEALADEMMAIYLEYEERQSIEARIAYAIDKLEANFQHTLADIATWDQKDFDYQTNFAFRKEVFAVDPILAALKKEVDRDTMEKIARAGQLDRANTTSVEDYLSGLPAAD